MIVCSSFLELFIEESACARHAFVIAFCRILVMENHGPGDRFSRAPRGGIIDPSLQASFEIAEFFSHGNGDSPSVANDEKDSRLGTTSEYLVDYPHVQWCFLRPAMLFVQPCFGLDYRCRQLSQSRMIEHTGLAGYANILPWAPSKRNSAKVSPWSHLIRKIRADSTR